MTCGRQGTSGVYPRNDVPAVLTNHDDAAIPEDVSRRQFQSTIGRPIPRDTSGTPRCCYCGDSGCSGSCSGFALEDRESPKNLAYTGNDDVRVLRGTLCSIGTPGTDEIRHRPPYISDLTVLYEVVDAVKLLCYV